MLLRLPIIPFAIGNILEGIAIALCYETVKPVSISVEDIKSYNLFDKKDNSFIASLIGIKHDNHYFANILENNKIISVSDKAFTKKESIEIFYPLKKKENFIYALVFNFNSNNKKIEPQALKKFSYHDFCEVEVISNYDRNEDLCKVLDKCGDLLE